MTTPLDPPPDANAPAVQSGHGLAEPVTQSGPTPSRQQWKERIAALLEGPSNPTARDALLDELARYQETRIPAFARLRAHRQGAALPTDVFRFTRVAAHPAEADQRTFRTSGTTHGERGAHHFQDLSLYKRAAFLAAQRMLFPDVDGAFPTRPTQSAEDPASSGMRLLILAPSETAAPDSSLSFMLSRFCEWFGRDSAHFWPLDANTIAALDHALRAAEESQEPVAILATSFALVHADDALSRNYALSAGSRIMQTGGFKGKSREVDPSAMRAMLTTRYGVPESHIVAEYGMTELSSQMYETSLVDALAGVSQSRRYWAPPWMRVTAVDPESLRPTDGVGILRLDDAANLDSVCAIQTADRARLFDDGCFELLGRDPNAVPRGCSLAVEEALASSGDPAPYDGPNTP